MTADDADRAELLSPAAVARHRASTKRLIDALGEVLYGQDDVIESAVLCLLARGHLLLEGLPGLGKTELVKGLARLLRLEFGRIQFTPDLLPGDISGTHVLEQKPDGGRTFAFHKGPVFANLVLADEINRASPKTQAALLEAMQEGRVTLFGTSHRLPVPFFVLATQNPIELEGTYPLPEAQLDRFLFKIEVRGVGADVLARIVTTRLRGAAPEAEPVVDAAQLDELFAAVDRIHLPHAVADYIGRLVEATHPSAATAPETVRRFVKFGASPRAAIGMAGAGRAAALLAGKPNVGFEEVRRVAKPVLRHRLIAGYQAGLEGITQDRIIDDLLAGVHELRRVPNEVEG